MGKSTINGHFPVCKLLVYQRVTHQKKQLPLAGIFSLSQSKVHNEQHVRLRDVHGNQTLKATLPGLVFFGRQGVA
jgi:hypothetical protein